MPPTPTRIRVAQWRARQVQNAKRLRTISAQVTRLIGTNKHTAEDAPIVRQLEKTIRSNNTI
jgi:hypothetical protein